MGCFNTKLSPEVPEKGNIVNTVYSSAPDYLENGINATQVQSLPADTTNNSKLEHQQQMMYQNNDHQKPQQQQRTKNPPNNNENEPDFKVNKKVVKYRAKFDLRVTAKYDIKALIGRGSFSRVVRVENRSTKQPYAIKMVDRIQGREVCEAELNVLRRVKHTYIIQLIEVFESKDKIYMVMELATGGELFDRIISKGTFTERDATKVLYMVLDGIKYLHSVGITHRDLKPENLLYYHPGPDSKILITDFGLSAFRKSMDGHMHTICGTSEYIAPEILARKPYCSQVDLWAVGIITYILLSGSMPFDDDNIPRLYRLILKAKYSYESEHWKDVSPLAKNFIDSLLTLDSTLRLTAPQALRHPWITTHAASSSNKNLHRTISKNLQERQSHNSVKSGRSIKSVRSNRSARSIRSENRRVMPEDIDALHKDPEVQADLTSLSGFSDKH